MSAGFGGGRRETPGRSESGGRWGSVVGVELAGRAHLDLAQELDVGPGPADPVEEQLQGLLRLEGAEDAAELVHDLQLLGCEEQLLPTGAGGIDVDGGEDPPRG